MYGNVLGSENIAIGTWALEYNAGGSRSVAIGDGAMRNAYSATGSFTTYNTAV
jgi:hypothetical protein